MSMASFAKRLKSKGLQKATAGRSKYKAKRTIINGIAFASGLEAAVYEYHAALEKAGEIEITALQPQVILRSSFNPDTSKPWHMNKYKPDMAIRRAGMLIYIEAKGFETELWRRNKRIWQTTGPARLEIWKGRRNRNGAYSVWCHEVITPPGVSLELTHT